MDSPDPPKLTGLECPACRKQVATIESVTARGVKFYCPSCRLHWSTKDAQKTSAQG